MAVKTAFEAIRRTARVFDDCLAGTPAEERETERRLKEREAALREQIARLVAEAGLPVRVDWAQAKVSFNQERRRTSQEKESVRQNRAALDGEIKRTNGELQRLENSIGQLEAAIGNRWLFFKIWFAIFPDRDKEELAREIGQKDAIRAKLEQLRAQSKEQQRRKSELDRKLAALDGQLRALDQAIQAETGRESCAVRLREIRDIQRRRNEKRQREWTAAADALSAAKDRIRVLQPKIDALGPDGFGRAAAFPEMLSAGYWQFSGGGRAWAVPRLLPFPLPKALRFPADDKGRAGVREFLLRAFQCIPPDTLEITVADPKGMGASLEGFQGLLENRKPFPDGRFLTLPREIEDALAKLHASMADFLQRDCTGGIRDWASYNAAHPGHPRPCRILAMFDLPDQLSGAAVPYLEKILANGPRCGVFPLVTCNAESLDSRRDAALAAALAAHAWDAFGTGAHVRELAGLAHLRLADETPCPLPDAAGCERLLSALKAEYRRRDQFVGAMDGLYSGTALWSADSRDGLSVPVGWRETADRAPVSISLGNRKEAVVHALLGGKTGSGKSNLVHVLIHSLCHRYSPDELELYLLDFKEGTELNAYAHPLLPHARLVATESDVGFGLSVLRHLEDVMKERNAQFKAAGVANLFEYREKTGRNMPRILLVADEFQKLFENRSSADAAFRSLENLLRQGRNAGCHVLLATQSLRGLREVGSFGGLTAHIACRIVLNCSPEDSSALLGNSNDAAVALSSPPQAILNNSQGDKSANVVFAIPEAVRDLRARHLETLHGAAAAKGFDFARCRVFRGDRLPDFPSPAEFGARCAAAGSQFLLLGRTAGFDAAPVLPDMAGRNLLLVGRYPFVPALKRALAESLARQPDSAAVLLHAGGTDAWRALAADGGRCVQVGEDWDGANLDEFANRPEPRKLVVLDGLENLRALHSSGYSYSSRNSPTFADRLRALVERPEKTGVQLVLCAKDYARAKAVAKDLIAQCGLRIGDGSVGDLGSFVSFEAAGSVSLPALGTGSAILADRDEGERLVFCPFAAEFQETPEAADG